MDYFVITEIWYEKIGNKAGAKVRFQKLDLSSKSWWAAKGSSPPLPLQERDFDSRPENIQCSNCGKRSPHIYNEGWMCLQPTCKYFWVMNKSASTEVLTFHHRFLNYRTHPDPTVQPHYSLVPDLLSTMSEDNGDISSLRVAWKGIVCPQCSKCISRKFWRGWKCSDDLTPSAQLRHKCQFEITLKMPLISLRAVIDEFELSPIKRSLFFDPKFMTPKVDDTSLFPYRKLTYGIPGVGVITHLVSNRTINSRVTGPNDMFRDLQAADLGLRRFPLQQSVVAGTLTAHFAVNYVGYLGMPYKYVVSVDSKGFNEAPNEVIGALGRLTWATEKAVEGTGDTFQPPNEMLVLGYFEDMKIGYHDDGESSLGPTIATLSLGGKSTMLIRMKYKYYHGLSRAKKLLDIDPVPPGCAHQEERQSLETQLEHRLITQKTYNELRAKLLKNGRHMEAPPCVKMELNHGDFVVMHGENLQKYFEHSVIPEKKLRFALTARYIKPDHIDAKELKKGQFTLLPNQVYDGK
ncbi:hypothetical protein BBP40_006493 [Aspergillus hancockii]|nr:hypothetical protein BBP40_006493 [Aspergillus hancockii]